MSVLARIRAHGGDVLADQWRMVLRPGKLPPAALDWMKQPEVRARVHREVWPLVDEWQERAAIREFDGGQDRAAAEAAAYEEVTARW
ncbi:hypothetical protein [Tateyamaria sp.]|uniref:hypothetical protein n=1 Tax=Tateyamaria sp. TaxID=1929288 RepID=UPI003B21510E